MSSGKLSFDERNRYSFSGSDVAALSLDGYFQFETSGDIICNSYGFGFSLNKRFHLGLSINQLLRMRLKSHRDDNQDIVDITDGNDRLVPQFVANPGTDDFESFESIVAREGVKSVRFHPDAHHYPLVEWVVGSWLDWLRSVSIPLWIPASGVDPTELHDSIADHPELSFVLCEVHYTHVPWLIPLLKSLSNVYTEISRFVIADGVKRLIDCVGVHRVLFGSRFPESSMGHQLYNLHRNGLSDADLEAICKGNLDRLLYSE